MSETPRLMVHYRKHKRDAFGDRSMTAAREPTVPEVVAWLREQGTGQMRQWHEPISVHPKGRSDLGDDLPAGVYLIVPVEEPADD